MLQIVLEGIIGCRKSTILRKLSYYGIPTALEPLREYRHLLADLFDPTKAFGAQMQIILSLSRHQQQKRFNNPHDIIVYERCLQTAKHVFVKAMQKYNLLSEKEVEILINTVDGLIEKNGHQIDTIFYLKTSTSNALDSIKMRARQGEQAITYDYLETLSALYENYLGSRKNVIMINVDDLENKEITNFIFETIKTQMGPKLPYWYPKGTGKGKGSFYDSRRPEPKTFQYQSSNYKGFQDQRRKPKKKYQIQPVLQCYLCSAVGHRFKECPSFQNYSSHFSPSILEWNDESSNSTYLESNESCTMTIGITKIHELATIPKMFYQNDSGFDLFIVESVMIKPGCVEKLNIGLKIQLPENTYGEIHNRSSWAKNGIQIFIGIIDSTYEGPIFVQAYNFSNTAIELIHQDKIAQIIFKRVMKVKLMENSKVIEMPQLPRRKDRGFGSTDLIKKNTKENDEETKFEDLAKEFEYLFNEKIENEKGNVDEESREQNEEEEI